MNAIPLINNIPKTNINNEKQLRQEINTSLVALKKEAGTLEGLINEAAQMLVTINDRIATLENDTVKKSDVVDVIQSGNLQPVTSNAVSGALSDKADIQSSEFTNSMAGAIQYHTNFYAPDLNTLTASGFFSVNIANASSSHAPIVGGATLIVCRFNDSNNFLSQIITYIGNTTYTRTCNNGTWSNWQMVILGSEIDRYQRKRRGAFSWGNSYSSGYCRLATITSYDNGGNHDISLAGLLRRKLTYGAYDFYFNLQCKGNANTLNFSRFSAFALNGGSGINTHFVATVKVTGNVYTLSLYSKREGWARDLVEAWYATNGDVFNEVDIYDERITIPVQWVADIPSNETIISQS